MIYQIEHKEDRFAVRDDQGNIAIAVMRYALLHESGRPPVRQIKDYRFQAEGNFLYPKGDGGFETKDGREWRRVSS